MMFCPLWLWLTNVNDNVIPFFQIVCLHPNLFPIFISNFHLTSPWFYKILVFFAINPIFLMQLFSCETFRLDQIFPWVVERVNVQRKLWKTSRSPGKVLLKATYKKLKKVCYLGSKRKINQGLLKTFALCCILSCYCVLCLSVRAVMSASTAPTRQETSSWNCTTGVSTSPAGAPTRSADRRLLKTSPAHCFIETQSRVNETL